MASPSAPAIHDAHTPASAKRTAALVTHHHTPTPLTLIGANIRPDTSQDHDPAPHSPSADEHHDGFLPLASASEFVFPSATSSPRTTPQHARRHSRVHSRNLSVFFPRPGQQPVLPPTPRSPAQVLDVPPASLPLDCSSADSRSPASSTTRGRRGHHHRHSLSHNFFPFLSPGYPASSACPPTPSSAASAIPKTVPSSAHHHSHQAPPLSSASRPLHQGFYITWFLAILALAAGATLWVSGSLALVALGYLTVSDSLWAVYHCVKPPRTESLRRPFGAARDQTLASFTRAVYLLFAAVYVCKEAFEQLVLPVHAGHHEALDNLTNRLSLIIAIITTAAITPSNPSLLKRYTTPLFGSILLTSSLLLSPSEQAILNRPTALLEILIMLHHALPEAMNKGSLLLQTTPLPNSDENSSQSLSLKTGLDYIKRNENRVRKVFPPQIWRLNEDRLITNVKLGVKWDTLSGAEAIGLVGAARSALAGVSGDDLSVDLVPV